jgi:peptide/nickel transport system substrate-binding protein
MKNKKTVWIAVIMIGTLLLAACGSSETPTQDTSGGGGSSATEPAATQSSGGGNNTASGADLALDPANASGDNALALVGYLYEGLVKVSDGEVVPALAVSYTVSEDGLDYIFNLRPGVTFHDGSALNADVVVLNFNRWFNPNGLKILVAFSANSLKITNRNPFTTALKKWMNSQFWCI